MDALRKKHLKEVLSSFHWQAQQLAILSLALFSFIVTFNNISVGLDNIGASPDNADMSPMGNGFATLIIGLVLTAAYIYRKQKHLKQLQKEKNDN